MAVFRPRAVLTVVTLLAHLAGATHMAFVAHTLSSTGAVVEASPRAHGAHQHQAGSVCEESTEASATWEDSDSCEAVAWSRVGARPLHPPVAHVGARRAVVSRELRTHETAWTAPPLVVAPKASPPALG